MDELNAMEDLNNIIVLNDEEGNEVEFEFLDLIEYKDAEYVVLLPTGEDDCDVVILQLVAEDPDSDNESFGSVDDPVTLQAVFEIFKEKFKDQFDFED